ncbi:transmembrane protein 35-like [Dermatophagoides farinae]|uniref:Novel acetylcholine receptor chaperone n=1 Tax=Dermatophagoides farinae TaxID=6954 RepID=A0A9D4P676_DERFA|nr:uncharacterized protein LOC124495102 [Dermatophagoides farinae]XP_046914397.1 uncharacterized protein LOC124495102 [Dermatophagoides farinae]KAH7644868.1 transmembrane protein 35-like [Dermatophagoides farinae]
MARIARMVFTSLSLFLGMFFFFFGLIKVSRFLNSEIHREMRRNFVRYAKVIPLVTTSLGLKVSPKYFRLTVGYAEIIAGLLLAFCPGRIKQWMNVFLIALSIGAIHTHLAIGDDYNKMIPAVAFCSMLTTRLILYFLLKRIDDQQQTTTTTFVPVQSNNIDKTEPKTTTTIVAKQASKIPETNKKWTSIFTIQWWFGRFVATLPNNRNVEQFLSHDSSTSTIVQSKTRKSTKTTNSLMDKEPKTTTTKTSSSVTSGHATKNRRKRNKQKNE